MKKLLKYYSFYPAKKQIHIEPEFLERKELSIESFLLITNVTTGDMIYIFNEGPLGGTYESNTLTLDYDTTSMSETDKIQIFVDIEPALNIKGPEGELRGGEYKSPVYVSLEELHGTFRQILKELKKMNLHLESMTDLNLTNRDLDGDI